MLPLASETLVALVASEALFVVWLHLVRDPSRLDGFRALGAFDCEQVFPAVFAVGPAVLWMKRFLADHLKLKMTQLQGSE